MDLESPGSARSWHVSELPGLECFQASALTHEYGRHSHPDWAIGVFEDGIGGTLYRGAREYVQPGEIVVINAEEVHTGYPADGRPLTYRMFYAGRSFFDEILAIGPAFPRFGTMRITDPDGALRLRQVHRGLCGEVGLSEETALIEAIRGLVSVYSDVTVPSPRGVEPAAVRNIKEFLRTNFGRNVRIAELAALTGLDRAYLIRSFRQAVGMPPHEWLLQVRIEEAKRLLASGQAIADVALNVGFADQSHLTRRFKSVTGLSPGYYARGHFCSRRVSQ